MKVIQMNDSSILKVAEASKPIGDYKQYEFTVPSKTLIPEFVPMGILSGSERIKASVKSVNTSNKLYNKIFIKEFSLDNPSAMRSAKLILETDIACKIELNKLWLNQEVVLPKLNNLDITGYLQKGNNQIMLDFPFVAGDKSFAAKINIEYM